MEETVREWNLIQGGQRDLLCHSLKFFVRCHKPTYVLGIVFRMYLNLCRYFFPTSLLVPPYSSDTFITCGLGRGPLCGLAINQFFNQGS